MLIKVIKHPEKIIYGFERLGLLDWISEERYIKIVYRLAFGRKLHLNNPQAFTEKINWYKLFWREPLMKVCADKYEVRKYVQECVGEKYLNEIYGIWEDFDEIDFEMLPEKFVLKPTNGSGDVVICENKKTFDQKKAKKVLMSNKKRHFSSKTKEWAYYNLPFRIVAERYIESDDCNQIKDYKFFCFDGEPKFLFVASERGSDNLKFDYFDMEWNWLPVRNAHDHNPNLEKPGCFSEMVTIVRRLSKAFPHVRVDLYEEQGRVLFGEMTFYHFGGFTTFEPDEWDYKFGKYFNLNNIKRSK
ncbi:MAG: glycosyl transferase [Lachnospiraceae bacterium]|nr:glycosyl transferase [Lachnospiraceae bacterium]